MGFLVTLVTFVFFAFLGGLLKLIPFGKFFSKPVGAVKSFFIKPSIQKTWHNKVFRIFLLILGLSALIILPRVWGSYWNYVIGTVGIYVLMGLGLNLIVGLSGQLVLGFAAFIAVGAYTAALLNAPEPHNLMLGSWIAFIVGIGLAAFAGALIGLPIMKLRVITWRSSPSGSARSCAFHSRAIFSQVSQEVREDPGYQRPCDFRSRLSSIPISILCI